MSYTPLDAARREIRVLSILPCDCMCLRVSIASLDDEDINYHALSYCWGDVTDTRTITLHDESLTVTANLYDALLPLRTSGYRSIWADAICINQSDLEERAEQVRIMDSVYRMAETVVVWLGRADEQTAETAHILDQLHSGRTIWQLQSLGGEAVDFIQACRLILALLSRPWFSRLWIWQERLLGQRGRWYCGNIRMHCTGIYEYITNIRDSGQMAVWWSTGDRSLKAVEHYVYQDLCMRVNESEQLLNNRKFETAHMSALDLLWNCSGALCSDPRDKVYGMMGLIPSLKSISVDYRAPVLDVYTAATKEITRHLQGLDILFLAGSAPDHKRLSEHHPSWVPSFNHAPRDRFWAYNLWLRSERYQCAGALRLPTPLPGPNITLYVQAHFVDTVSEIGPTWPGWGREHPLASTLSITDPNARTRAFSQWSDEQIRSWAEVFQLGPYSDELWDVLLVGGE